MKNYSHTKNHTSLGVTMLAIASACLITTTARAVDLNYDNLSSLEEPLAFDYQDITFSFTGLADAASVYKDESGDTDTAFLANFQISAETQLDNSWTLGAAYFGQYDELDFDDEYSDNAALFLGGIWGTASAGNVTGLVREQTRRLRGTGNAELLFDDQLGELSDYGVAYIGRFGAAQLIATIDEDNNYEVGSIFQRPIGNKDYRFSLRYRDSEFTSDDEITTFDSQALGFVTQLTYGSSIFDIGLGIEELSTPSVSIDRRYVSLGAMRKIGRFTVSGEAHFGDIEGQSETSYSAGLKADIARGLSLNLGVNYGDAVIDVDGVSILDEDDTEASLSLRYSF